jgi:ubiquinone/menaquinone biosynthesis C-methylase UbiE
MFLDLLGCLREPRAGDAILDLGCGRGEMVAAFGSRGLAASGCDFPEELENVVGSEDLRPIRTEPYALPFGDATFDYVVSSQVFEHVMNMDDTFAEIRRVLRVDGIGLHIFTGRYCVLEPHTFVPLASMLRTRWWLGLWARLGVRNEFQRGMTAREVADTNFRYLRDHTNYPPKPEVLRLARRHFETAVFRDDLFVDIGTSSLAEMTRRVAGAAPFVRSLVSRYYLVRRANSCVLVLRP